MESQRSSQGDEFLELVSGITEMSVERHLDHLIRHAENNKSKISKTLRELPPLKGKKKESAIIVSAGPSVHRQRSIHQILEAKYKGTIIAVDGSMVSCLKAGLIPDFVLTLDPHVKRVVRWYGDPDLEENSRNDDYFARQDLDVEFRNNMLVQNLANIELVNKHGHQIKSIVASCSPPNVVKRIEEARFDSYWWNPLVDDPKQPDSITRRLHQINKLPCMNTGGNVGGASWVLAAAILKIPHIALVGMDFGYYADLPYNMTQNYYELIKHLNTMEGLEKYFPEYTFPLTGERYYTDPTYYWYRRNFLDLLSRGNAKTYNCTGGGVLFGDDLPCMTLSDFFSLHGA